MPPQNLLQKVYRLFSFRDRSEKEIRDFLIRKKAQNPDEIIEKLKEQGYINDERFARAWLESRRRSRHLGTKAIKRELVQKGIDREIIEEVTRGESLESSEEQIAEKALEKKTKIWKNLNQMEFKKKAIQYLMRKGFDYEVAKKTIDKFLLNS